MAARGANLAVQNPGRVSASWFAMMSAKGSMVEPAGKEQLMTETAGDASARSNANQIKCSNPV
jgi:hypothetical protein